MGLWFQEYKWVVGVADFKVAGFSSKMGGTNELLRQWSRRDHGLVIQEKPTCKGKAVVIKSCRIPYLN